MRCDGLALCAGLAVAAIAAAVAQRGEFVIVDVMHEAIFRWGASSQVSVFDPKRLPWTSQLTKNFRVFRAELESYQQMLRERGQQLPQFDEIDPIQSTLNADQRWQAFHILLYGQPTEAARYFPQSMALLHASPLTSAMFSVMAPEKFIPKHRGDYKGLLRYHIALDVPAGNFTSQKIRKFQTPYGEHPGADLYLAVAEKHYIERGETMPYRYLEWREGGDLLFDDTFVHFAENARSSPRTVLFADVPRHDLPAPLAWLNEVLLRHGFRFASRVRQIAHATDSVVRAYSQPASPILDP